MTPRKTTLLSLAISLTLFVSLPLAVIWAADPCQIFHRPFKGVFHHCFFGIDHSRCQNAGLINSYLDKDDEKFDSVLTGSSLSGNFRPEYIAQRTGLHRTLKLTMSGPRPLEQQITTARALATGKVTHVFWEVFPYQFLLFPHDTLDTLTKANEFPLYLYNSGRLDDYRYLLDRSTLSNALDILSQADFINISDMKFVDYWQHDCTEEKTCHPFYSEETITQINKKYIAPTFVNRSNLEISGIDFSAADRYLLSTILPYCNKSIQFDLFFPPLSLLWRTQQDQQKFDFQLYMLRYVVNKTQHCKNIRNFAFDNALWITGDLAHYHDPRHFYGGVHDYIIDSIAAGKHIITPSNVEAFEHQFISNVNSYVPWASTAKELSRSPH